MILPEWIINFCKWVDENPIKLLFFVGIPLSITTSFLTIMLLM